MKRAPVGCFLAPVMLLAACSGGGAASGLVVVPPEVENAAVPESKWEGIHAVYIYNIGYVSYDPIDVGIAIFPSYAYTHFAKIKLLTRASTEGGMFGNIPIRHLGDLYSIEAKVIKSDGTEVKLKDADYVHTVLVKDVVPDRTPPIDLNETQILFPGLNPGDVIQYSYTSRSPTLSWTFGQVDAPVMFSKFMVARPQGNPEIQPVIFDHQKINPQQSKESGMATGMAGYLSIDGVSHRAVYDIWTAINVPPIPYEEAMPPLAEVASSVLVWQGFERQQWSVMGNTYYKWFSHYGRARPLAEKLAKEATAGVSDPRERARAIHDWVKNTLNIQAYDQLTGVPRQVEIETVDLEKLIKEKNATPEEAANLMWMMMNALGVDAAVVLASHSDRQPPLEELPSIYQFGHVLLALDDGTLIDTTNRLCPFGQVPWEFEGRKALWLKKGSVTFREIPLSRPQDNLRRVQVSASLDSDGSARLELEMKLTGQMALAWRRWLVSKQPKEKEDALRSIATLAAEKAEVEKFALENLEDFSKPLVIRMNILIPAYSQVLRDKMVLKASAFVHYTACPVLTDSRGLDLYVCPYPTTEKRHNPVRFPFRRLDDMEIKLAFPAGFYLQALPKGFRTREIEAGAVGLQTSYGSEEGKNLTVIRKFSVNELLVDEKGYPALRDLLRRYLAQKDTLLTLELPKM
jgi:hypothetical protein